MRTQSTSSILPPFRSHSAHTVSTCGGRYLPTVPISEGQSHFFNGCPSKDLRISIVVSPTDVGYNDHNLYGNILTLYEMSLLLTHKSHFLCRCACPYFWFWQVGNYALDLVVLLILYSCGTCDKDQCLFNCTHMHPMLCRKGMQ